MWYLRKRTSSSISWNGSSLCQNVQGSARLKVLNQGELRPGQHFNHEQVCPNWGFILWGRKKYWYRWYGYIYRPDIGQYWPIYWLIMVLEFQNPVTLRKADPICSVLYLKPLSRLKRAFFLIYYNYLCRERMTNSCMINWCPTSLRRHAGRLRFLFYCGFSLVMITLTISLPPSSTTIFFTMLKPLNCSSFNLVFSWVFQALFSVSVTYFLSKLLLSI